MQLAEQSESALMALMSQGQMRQGPVSAARQPGPVVQPQEPISLRGPVRRSGPEPGEGQLLPHFPTRLNKPSRRDRDHVTLPPLSPRSTPKRCYRLSADPSKNLPQAPLYKFWLTFQSSSRLLTNFEHYHGGLIC